MKAKFIGKTYGTGYDRDSIYLEYEYRGMRYTVHENRAKGRNRWHGSTNPNRTGLTVSWIPNRQR